MYAGPKEEGDKFTARFATHKKSSESIERTSLNVTMVPWSQITHQAAGGMIDLACIDGASQTVYTANLKNFDIAQQLAGST